MLEVDAGDAADPEPLARRAGRRRVAARRSSRRPTRPNRPPPSSRAATGSRRRAVRGAILVLLPLLVIVGIATAALGWYARSSYFVGVSGNEVVIYKGVPGGVLGWNPTVDERTGARRGAICPPLDRDRVQTNSSRAARSRPRRRYVERLQAAATTHDHHDHDHHDPTEAHDDDHEAQARHHHDAQGRTVT